MIQAAPIRIESGFGPTAAQVYVFVTNLLDELALHQASFLGDLAPLCVRNRPGQRVRLYPP